MLSEVRSGFGLASNASDSYQALANSPCMRRIDEIVTRVASTDVTVLISGESGVGKEVVARTLHRRSRRRDRPFVKVNCAALPLELLESELFGHERGAFTGAHQQKLGKFELADQGTIFLDEISETPLALQAKLLHVVQDHEFARVGSERDIRVDLRIVAATNRDLSRHIADGTFRADLFHRLNVLHIRVPPLRERREEIPVLVDHFLARYGRKYGGGPSEVSPATLERLWRYSWPGNVRELENVVQRIVVLGTEAVAEELGDPQTPQTPPSPATTGQPADAPRSSKAIGLKELTRRAAAAAERDALERMLDLVRWRRVEAAQRLQISYKSLLEKIKQHGLDATP
jgi:two-component system, NtrC family, response regulator AtoC